MAAEPYRLTVSDLIRGVRRRALLLGTVFMAILIFALAVATVLPPVYRSTGTILVESQQIPPDLVPTTVTTFADERIQVIRQRIMTREHQMRIIEKHRLFSDQDGSMTPSDMLEAMRESTVVTPIYASGGRRGAAAIAFQISFDHRSPQIAQAIANELVTLFLNENARARTQRASETTQFLTREAAKLEAELSHIENELALHKQRYSDALPEHLEMRMAMLQRTEGDLRNVQREAKSALEEVRFLDVELSAARAGLHSDVGDPQETGQLLDTLGALKQEYARLSLTYTESHPDLRVLSRRIAALEEAEGLSPGPEPRRGMSESDLRIAKVETRLTAAGDRLESLREQEVLLQARIERIEAQILKTPQVQRQLTTLMRDYGNAQSKYEEVREKQIDAQMAESLEQEEKAERFSLLEPPLLPEGPVKPNRTKIVALGVFLAIGSSGGLAFMLESMNRRIRGAGALTQLIGRPPLVAIPYITTMAEIRRRRARRMLAIVAFLVLVATVAAAVHHTYMPLDQLLMKAAAHLG